MSEAAKFSPSQMAALRSRLKTLLPDDSSASTQAAPGKTIPELGVIFFSGLSIGQNPYELLLEVAKFVDESGFNAIWTPERHFTEVGGAYPNPSVLAAALATVTRHVRLRAGSINLPLHDPMRVAEEWAVVDNLSGGRVDLALAPGWHVRDFVLKSENFTARFDIMNDYRRELSSLWEGVECSRIDANGHTQKIVTYPRPVQRQLPLWLTTSQKEEAWRFAGDNGLNVLTALINFGPKDLEKRIRIYREARAAAGLDPAKGVVSLMLHTYLDQSDDAAIETVRAPLSDYLKSFVGQHQTANTDKDAKVNAISAVGTDSDDFVDMVFSRYINTSSLIGSPERAATILKTFKSMGVDEVACLVDFGVTGSDTLNSLRLLSSLIREQQ
ncbi:LLM class flavin-dependent oxidoreductase [Marinobacterium sp. D7]|uniref:MupA/Atu3671 family FMN-dependent luciferase-like monooxygenase n=1 Tax=Marinobacterium ramblicola TaxID=2849041 RepID=UPI001C2D1F33|nr:MupA/Atu3671 family FMN-dependent luciferase-like monooxygenase [Marinobacterium ramblicola]MBV1787464.1 LLM class flavin-dependent oxidoreductase [Marinobacterium ramblicola]